MGRCTYGCFFPNHLCQTLGPGGGMLVVGQACVTVGCLGHILPHPPQCFLTCRFVGSWKRRPAGEVTVASCAELLPRATAAATACASKLGFATLAD